MPTITKITPQKRAGRFNVFLDEHYAFPVSESTLVRFHLTKGLEVDAALQEAIASAQAQAEANALALTYISTQQRTRFEVRTKLAGADLPPAVIDAALDYLTSLHYLDDAQYAESFINDDLALSDKGPSIVSAKLAQRGVAGAVIADAVAAVADDAWLPAARRAGKKAANQSARQPFAKRQQKVRLAVMQKGFTAAVAEQVLADLQLEADPDAERDRLVAEAEKQWRLKRKYDGYERRMRVKQALYRKGYQLDAIDEVLGEMED